MRSDIELLNLHESAALQALIKLPPDRDGYRTVATAGLASAVGTDAENVVLILRKLERAGLVTRVGAAGRGQHLVRLGPETRSP